MRICSKCKTLIVEAEDPICSLCGNKEEINEFKKDYWICNYHFSGEHSAYIIYAHEKDSTPHINCYMNNKEVIVRLDKPKYSKNSPDKFNKKELDYFINTMIGKVEKCRNTWYGCKDVWNDLKSWSNTKRKRIWRINVPNYNKLEVVE